MTNNDLAELQKESGQVCISIIIPTHRLSSERQADIVEVKKTIARAKETLKRDYPVQAKSLLIAIDELADTIDFTHNDNGIGLFVSPRIKKLIKFPFDVKEKVILNRSFEIKDILYTLEYTNQYYLLHITEKAIQLFQGTMDELKEVKDQVFPWKIVDQFEYAPPSVGSSYVGHAQLKSFENDKEAMKEIRLKEEFEKIDKKLPAYINHDTLLAICGPKKELALFERNTSLRNNIITKLPGNYTYTGNTELGNKIWPKIKAYIESKKATILKDFEEKIGEKHGIEGIKQIWEAANEGRGLKLIVEKDFSKPAFITDDDNKLYFKPPKTKHGILPDVIDTIIKVVLNKKGKVVLVENDALINHQRIALITRY